MILRLAKRAKSESVRLQAAKAYQDLYHQAMLARPDDALPVELAAFLAELAASCPSVCPSCGAALDARVRR
ncbi:MAG: hypothetical protein RBU21_05990 [FCB group bacterium]|nr:hypothetical protein [FCB group bacterium]